MPRTPTPAVLLLLASSALSAVVLPAQARRFGPEDVKAIVRLDDPRVSPDGRLVLVLATRGDHAANAWRAELVVVDAASGRQRVLARGLGGLSQPRWSPKGDRVAFLARAGGARQVHVVSAAGGTPRVVTRAPAGVEAFAWRPDGLAFAVAATELPRAGARAIDPFEVGNDHYMTAAPPAASHLWVVPASGGPGRRLTSGRWSLTTSISGASLSWTPDGRAIAVVRIASASPGDADQGTVQLVDARTGEARALTGRAAGEGLARVSPDGSRIAYSYARDGEPANVEEVYVAPAGGGAGESATRGIDRQVALVDWWPDSRALLVAGADGTRGALWVQPLGGAARKLPLGDVAEVVGASVSARGDVAFVGVEPARPAELYLLPDGASAPRRLTSFHDAVAGLALGRGERVTWATHDGMTADGVVTYPPGYEPGRRYPLVLMIHGGPTASSNEAFLARIQLLAAEGWVVFQPNYRGSDNLGNAFQRAIADDAAEGPGRDVVAGVDELVRRGVADSARVAVSGWSYGGFMTAWLIGRYPTRWRAAVAGAAPVDLTDMYALADLNVMRRHAITGSPFVGDRLARYMAMSPIAHLSKARAPTLVMSNVADVRVTVTGSYKIYHALKDNGVPVRFVAFPGGGHSPPDPVRQLERERLWVEWLKRWL